MGGGQVGRLPEEPSDHEVEAFLAMGERFGIRTPFCCLENDFTLADLGGHGKMLAKTLDQITSASRCGATHVRLFAGFAPNISMDEATWQRLLTALEACDKLCAELGMEIAIETHGALRFNDDGSVTHINSVTTDRASLQRLMNEMAPRIGFNYDPGNIKAIQPDDDRYAVDIINARINYWIACAVGDDDLDYGPVFRRMDFGGVYLIEYEPLHDLEDGIQRSLDYLSKVAPRCTKE